MASNYPGAYDVLSDPGTNLAGPPTHSAMHNQLNDAIEAIEHELGLDPRGAFATVRARLDKLALGVIARAYQSSTGQNITSEADVAGCSVTWTADPTRWYRTVARVVLRQSATGAEQYATITTGANGQLQSGGVSFGPVAANGIATHFIEVIENNLSGSTTRKLRASTSGALAQPAASPYQAFIAVYDMGAV